MIVGDPAARASDAVVVSTRPLLPMTLRFLQNNKISYNFI